MSVEAEAQEPADIRTRARAAADEVQRALVAEAVCSVIAAEGMEAATLRRIADELGCTTGLISHYFRSKEAMLIHALEHTTRRIGEVVTSDLGTPRTATIEDNLRSYCAALPLDDVRMQYWRVLAAFRSSALTNPRLREFFQKYGESQSAHYRPLLAAATGRLPDDAEVQRLDQALDALLEGFGLAATERPELFTPDQVFEAIKVALDAWILETKR